MFTWSGLVQDGEEIATAPDFRVWSEVEARGEDAEADQVVHLEARYSEALGRYYVTRFSVESTAPDIEVNGSMLRELRIHESLREALSGSLEISLSNGDLYDDAQPHMAAASLREAGPSNEESMLAVARVYRAAQIANRPAAKAVANVLGLTAPTATLWIRRARSLGLLGTHADG